MWVDSGAAALSFASILINLITYIFFIIIIGLFTYQYLKIRNNKTMSKMVAGIGIFISVSIFSLNSLMIYSHIDFVQEQIAIVNNSEYQIGSFIPHIREDWIKNGNRIITWNIVYSIFFGVLPFRLFYKQYRRRKY